jgi:hypothetical protein
MQSHHISTITDQAFMLSYTCKMVITFPSLASFSLFRMLKIWENMSVRQAARNHVCNLKDQRLCSYYCIGRVWPTCTAQRGGWVLCPVAASELQYGKNLMCSLGIQRIPFDEVHNVWCLLQNSFNATTCWISLQLTTHSKCCAAVKVLSVLILIHCIQTVRKMNFSCRPSLNTLSRNYRCVSGKQ